MRTCYLAVAGCIFLGLTEGTGRCQERDNNVRTIGSRLELFVDPYLIESMTGVTRELHSPSRREVVMTFDRPWEGEISGMVTVFSDEDLFRMYYCAWGIVRPLTDPNPYGKRVTCYAESRDGITWRRPDLGLNVAEATGTTSNNIVFQGTGLTANVSDSFVPFKDTNPDCPPEARYKAVGRTVTGMKSGFGGLLALKSPDGIHWTTMQDEPIIVSPGLDGQGGVSWDSVRGRYVEFERGGFRNGYRDIATHTSDDFLHWSEFHWLDYGGAPTEQLYNNATFPYYRAPHIFVSFVMRFVPGRQPVDDIVSPLSEAVFMSSRDGIHFDRSFMEGWIRPGLDPLNWGHGHGNNWPAWALIQTGPEEMSVYWVEHWEHPGRPTQLRRGTLRLDGFVSVHAAYAGGEFITKPLVFEGRELAMNFSTSAVGSVQVEIRDAAGNPIPGFALADCLAIYGDAIEQTVKWQAGSDVSALAGQVVRLRFVMKDADLYAIRFLSPSLRTNGAVSP